MKKLLGILVLGLILFVFTADAFAKTKRTTFKKGAIISGKIVWDKRFGLDLPPGQWVVVDIYPWTVNAIHGKYVALAQIINGNTIDKFLEMETVNINGKWVSYLQDWFHSIFFADPYDGCYERPEYYLLVRYKKGAAFNCFLVRHMEMQKALFAPDDVRRKTYTAIIRKFTRDNDLKFPPIMLSSHSLFYAQSIIGNLYSYSYWIDPETHGASKNKFFTEDTSEYHPANINKYPDKKKFMESFISQEAYKHQLFEERIGAKPKHILDLDQHINEKNIKKIIKTKSTTKIDNSKDIVKKLKDLNALYESGALTKEEYKKAKKKVLSQ